MAENSEKKVLISVEVLDNFIKTKKNADNAREAFKFLQDSVSKLELELRNLTLAEEKDEKAIKAVTDRLNNQKAALREQAQVLAKTNNEFKEAKTQLEAASKSQDMLAAAGEKTNKTLGEMQRELKALRNTPLDFGNPAQVREVEQAMADLTAEIDDYKTKIKGLDTGEFAKNITGVAEAGSALLQITGQVSGALGIENETFKKLQDSTVELIGATQALGVITEFLDKKKLSLVKANIAVIASNVKEKIGAIATAGANLILGKSVDATTTKFKLLRGAIIGTGIGALVVLIGLLIANWDKLSAALGGTANEQKKLDAELNNASRQLESIKSNSDFNVAIAEAAGKSKEELLKMRLEAARAANELAYLKMQQVLSNENASKEQRDKAIQMEQETYDRVKSILDESTIYYISKKKEQSDKSKSINERDLQATFDILSRNKTEQIRVLEEIANDDKKTNSERLLALAQAEEKKIELLRLTAEKELSKEGLTAKEKRKIQNDLANDIKNVKSDTEKAITSLEELELDKRLKKSAETLEKRKQQLSDQQSAELEKLSADYTNAVKSAKTASDLVALQKQYEKDKFDTAQKYRESDFNESINALTSQLNLENLSAEQRIEIEKAIANAKSQYAQESAQIAIKANEDVVKNHEEAVNKQIELEQQLKDKKQELYSQLQTTLQDITNGVFERKSMELDEETSQITKNYDDQIAAAEGNDAKQKKLEGEKQKRIEDQEAKKRKLVREQAIIERAFQAFQIGIETTKSVGAISLKTAEITAAAALNPLLIPSIAISAAQIPVAVGIGALQLASVMAAPLPKAKRGKVFKGPAHENGGIPVEVEGDEIILTKGVYRDPLLRNIASMINQAGGGIPLTSPSMSNMYASGGVTSFKFQDGGYLSRSISNETLTEDKIENAMEKALAKLKIYVAVEDIRREDKKYTDIEDRASF